MVDLDGTETMNKKCLRRFPGINKFDTHFHGRPRGMYLYMEHAKISKRRILSLSRLLNLHVEFCDFKIRIQFSKGKYVFETVGHGTWDLRMPQCRVGARGGLWPPREHGIVRVTDT